MHCLLAFQGWKSRHGEVQGPESALEIVDHLDLDPYYLLHAIRADLLRRMGRIAEATAAYDAAIERASNASEREFLRRRRDELTEARSVARIEE